MTGGPIDIIREACHRCGSQPSAETRSERHGQDWCNVCWDRVQPPPSAILAALTEVERLIESEYQRGYDEGYATAAETHVEARDG